MARQRLKIAVRSESVKKLLEAWTASSRILLVTFDAVDGLNLVSERVKG